MVGRDGESVTEADRTRREWGMATELEGKQVREGRVRDSRSPKASVATTEEIMSKVSQSHQRGSTVQQRWKWLVPGTRDPRLSSCKRETKLQPLTHMAYSCLDGSTGDPCSASRIDAARSLKGPAG